MTMKSTQIRLVAINRGDLLLASSMDLMSYLRRSQLHNPDFSSTILEFVGRLLDSANRRFCESQNLVTNQTQNAESGLDSANSQNLVNLNPCEAPKTKFLLLLAFAKRRVPLHLVLARKSVGFSWQSIKQ